MTKNEEQIKILKQRIKEGKCPVCDKSIDITQSKTVVDANIGECQVCLNHFEKVEK